MSSFFDIYDAVAAGVRSEVPVAEAIQGEIWSYTATECSAGIAASVPAGGIAPLYPSLKGLPLREAAKAAASWNLAEAAAGLAAANAFYNTPERIQDLSCSEPYEAYCTRGMDFSGKTVGVVGHMHPDRHMNTPPKAMYILERHPQPGDYPDSACDFILPQCDIVFITGSALSNKTLPHLLELCRDAYTILIGPSVPLCPALLDFGIDRLSGMAVTNAPAMRELAVSGRPSHPYGNGTPFLLVKK